MPKTRLTSAEISAMSDGNRWRFLSRQANLEQADYKEKGYDIAEVARCQSTLNLSK